MLNDEELEAENEDHTLEVDEDDALASNDEKDEEDVYDEEAVDEEEENDDEDEEEEVNPKLAAISSSGPAASDFAHQTVVKLPPQSAIVQSVIREPLSSPSSNPVAVEPHHGVHPRLLPPAIAQQSDKPALSPVIDPNQGSPDKRKRPQHQPKKCPSPNPMVDFGADAGYPYAPDATKVAVSAVPPSPAHVAYIRPPATVSAAAVGVFKTMVPRTAGDVGFPPVAPVPYRTAANKMTGPAAYLPPPPPPQVQQVYQAPTPQPQLPSTSYSPYPIDYASTGAPLPPPPPTIAFRNVLVGPHEPALVPGATQQQQSAAGGGDSEFGGLVSYFSSQQEDDFDT